MKLSLFDYYLPPELIAQEPTKPRDKCRLLVLKRKTGEIFHRYFFNLTEFLNPGDVLVFNNSKVIPARFNFKKPTGGKMEIFLIKELSANSWEVLLGGRGKRIGLELFFEKNGKNLLKARLVERKGNGLWRVEFDKRGQALKKIIWKYGQVPTPPYIKKASNFKDYQTIYAQKEGSVAAPTAGLHFTRRLIKKLKRKGIQTEYLTLHVGLGTFAPVREEIVEKHRLEPEWVEIDKEVARRLTQAIKEKRRIIAVGTTVVRALESAYRKGEIVPLNQWVNLFIYPPYKFKVVQGMITNFHLPKSTLFILVSAFAGLSLIKRAYNEAIRRKYKFYSFGEAMLIL